MTESDTIFYLFQGSQFNETTEIQSLDGEDATSAEVNVLCKRFVSINLNN